MNFKNTLICFLLGISLSSCKKDATLEIKHDAVMAIHDEVMPKMSDIHKLKKNLKGLAETEESVELLRGLDIADDAMMDWMAQYHKPSLGDTTAEDYLDNQLMKVQLVKDVMLNNISRAQTYIESHE